jgi:hypothetical protein
VRYIATSYKHSFFFCCAPVSRLRASTVLALAKHATIYIPSFIKIGSGIQKWILGYIDRKVSHKPALRYTGILRESHLSLDTLLSSTSYRSVMTSSGSTRVACVCSLGVRNEGGTATRMNWKPPLHFKLLKPYKRTQTKFGQKIRLLSEE